MAKKTNVKKSEPKVPEPIIEVQSNNIPLVPEKSIMEELHEALTPDQDVLDSFDELLARLSVCERWRASIRKPQQHVYAIYRQIEMWRNSFKKNML